MPLQRSTEMKRYISLKKHDISIKKLPRGYFHVDTWRHKQKHGPLEVAKFAPQKK
jgi:hypothetical protein